MSLTSVPLHLGISPGSDSPGTRVHIAPFTWLPLPAFTVSAQAPLRTPACWIICPLCVLNDITYPTLIPNVCSSWKSSTPLKVGTTYFPYYSHSLFSLKILKYFVIIPFMDLNIKLLPFGDFFPIVLLAASSQQRALWPLTRVPLGGNLILPA